VATTTTTTVFVNVVFSDKDEILTNSLYQLKEEYKAVELTNELANKYFDKKYN